MDGSLDQRDTWGNLQRDFGDGWDTLLATEWQLESHEIQDTFERWNETVAPSLRVKSTDPYREDTWLSERGENGGTNPTMLCVTCHIINDQEL